MLFDVYNHMKCAVLDRSGWTEFYGPFAARALFAATASQHEAITLGEEQDSNQIASKRKMFQCESLEEGQQGVDNLLPTSKRHESACV